MSSGEDLPLIGKATLVSKEFILASFHAEANDLKPVSVDGFVGGISTKLMRLRSMILFLYMGGRLILCKEKKKH